MLEVFLILFILLSAFLAVCLYFAYRQADELNMEVKELEVDNDLLQRKVETLSATNTSLRAQMEKTPEDVVETEFRPLSDFLDDMNQIAAEESNPQHFRPMFDSQGPLFNTEQPVAAVPPTIEQVEEMLTPKRDYMFFPEDYAQEVVGDASVENTSALYAVDDQPETQVAPLPYEENLEVGKVVHGSFFDDDEEEPVDTGESTGPESVQDGEEATNGVLRSESVS